MNYVGYPKSTSLFSTFHIGIIFCFFPANLMSSNTQIRTTWTFSNCHNSPAKGWPYRFRSGGTTWFSILDNDFGHLCRGKRIEMSGHSDVGFFIIFGAFFIFTWVQGDTASASCPAHPGSPDMISMIFVAVIWAAEFFLDIVKKQETLQKTAKQRGNTTEESKNKTIFWAPGVFWTQKGFFKVFFGRVILVEIKFFFFSARVPKWTCFNLWGQVWQKDRKSSRTIGRAIGWAALWYLWVCFSCGKQQPRYIWGRLWAFSKMHQWHQEEATCNQIWSSNKCHFEVDVIAGNASGAAYKYYQSHKYQDLYNSSVAVMLKEMQSEVKTHLKASFTLIVQTIIISMNFTQQMILIMLQTQNYEKTSGQHAWAYTNTKKNKLRRVPTPTRLKSCWGKRNGRAVQTQRKSTTHDCTARLWCSSIQTSLGAPKQRFLDTTNRYVLAFCNSWKTFLKIIFQGDPKNGRPRKTRTMSSRRKPRKAIMNGMMPNGVHHLGHRSNQWSGLRLHLLLGKMEFERNAWTYWLATISRLEQPRSNVWAFWMQVLTAAKNEDVFNDNICKGTHDGELNVWLWRASICSWFLSLFLFPVKRSWPALSFVLHFVLKLSRPTQQFALMNFCCLLCDE